MTCPQNALILRSLSNELTPEAERDLQEHLAMCPVCRSAHEVMRTSWDALNDWQIDVSTIDLTERVLAEADSIKRQQTQSLRLVSYWTVSLRAAASIVLAVGLGVGAAYLVPVNKPTVVPAPSVALESMAEALDLIGLASDSATGLLFGLEPDETPEGGETS